MQALLQSQGIHHITLNGADRKTSIDFWQDILGMKLIFEQPNLDDLSINHLYFDCGDGRTITVFTNESRKPDLIKKDNSYHFENDILDKFEHLLKIESIGDKLWKNF